MNKTNITITVLISLIFICGVAIVFMPDASITGKVTAEKVIKVKIGYRAHLAYLPAYVAYKNKYFEAQGLQVELVPFQSTNHLVESVINGNVDAGVGGVNALVVSTIELKSPNTLKIFNQGILPETLDALLVKKDSNISSIQDLKGKTISSLPGTAAMTWMNSMLEKENLKGELTMVATKPSQQLSVLSSGNADAIFVLEPLVAVGAHNNISRVLIKSPITKYFKSNMLFETSIFSTIFLKNNPQTAKKIIAATDKAIDFINSNPELVKTYYSEFTPVSNSIESTLPVVTYLPSTQLNISGFQEMADDFYSAGLIKHRINAAQLFIAG